MKVKVKPSPTRPYARVYYYRGNKGVERVQDFIGSKNSEYKFLCEDCTRFDKGKKYCLKYRHKVKGRVTSCLGFRDRILSFLLG